MTGMHRFLFSLVITFISIVSFGKDQPPKNIVQFDAYFDQQKVDSEQIVNLNLDVKIIDNHYLYENKTQIIWPKDFPVKSGKLDIQPIKMKFDSHSKKERAVLLGKVKIRLTAELPKLKKAGIQSIPIGLKYQACSEKYCLLPRTKFVDLQFRAEGPNVGIGLEDAPIGVAEKESLSFEKALEKGWFFTFLFVFFAGVLTSFTPCVFPMIPITLAIIGSRAADISRFKSFLSSLSYVAGIAFTYSLLGLFAAKTGALFGSFMSNPIVVGAIAGVLIAMSLSMFGLFEIKTPSFISNRVMKSGQSSGYIGAFAAGLIAGVVASPCVGPVLVGILAFVAKTQDMALGFWLLFTFASGLGLLFLVLGTFSSLIQYLPRSGTWMDMVKFIFGVSMLALALYFASPLMPREWVLGIIGFGSMCTGFVLGFLQKPDKKHIWYLKKLIGSIGIAVGVFFIFKSGMSYQEKLVPKQQVEHGPWKQYSDEKLTASRSAGRPVIIDFKAEWCAACKELEEKTFTTKEFKELAENFDLYFVDATSLSEVSDLVERYNILGLPTVIFYDAKGKERSDLRVSGFEEIDRFSVRMKKAMN